MTNSVDNKEISDNASKIESKEWEAPEVTEIVSIARSTKGGPFNPSVNGDDTLYTS